MRINTVVAISLDKKINDLNQTFQSRFAPNLSSISSTRQNAKTYPTYHTGLGPKVPCRNRLVISFVDIIPVILSFNRIVPCQAAHRVPEIPEIAKGLPWYDFQQGRIGYVFDDTQRCDCTFRSNNFFRLMLCERRCAGHTKK
jgi:hypothetical protein